MKMSFSPKTVLCEEGKEMIKAGELVYLDQEGRKLCQKCGLSSLSGQKLNQK